MFFFRGKGAEISGEFGHVFSSLYRVRMQRHHVQTTHTNLWLVLAPSYFLADLASSQVKAAAICILMPTTRYKQTKHC